MPMEFNSRNVSVKALTLTLALMFLSTIAIEGCPDGYLDVDPESRYCFLVPYLPNNRNNANLHPNDGKTWTEAQQVCQDTGGGQLAIFQDENELERFLSFFENIYVVRDLYYDHTDVSGLYFPGNTTLCPEPPLGCSSWYFGLKRDDSTNEYRWNNNSPLNFDLWAPEFPDHGLISDNVEPKNCAAGPCSASFGLCKVSCSRKLGYICMVDRFRSESDSVATAAFLATSDLATSTSTTETPKLSMPKSMGAAGRLLMGIAESVLPEMVMKMVNQWIGSTNGLVYSGYIGNFGFSFR